MTSPPIHLSTLRSLVITVALLTPLTHIEAAPVIFSHFKYSGRDLAATRPVSVQATGGGLHFTGAVVGIHARRNH